MRIAVISDIHSNYDALVKALASIDNNEVDLIINLGDIISKGNNHRECIELLMESSIKSIKGNSELYLLNGVDIDKDVLDQREHFNEINNCLDDKHINYLKKLPMKLELNINNKRIYLAHFMFSNKDLDYPYYTLASVRDGSFYKGLKTFSKDYDLVVFGHAHHEIKMDNTIIIPSVGINNQYLLLDIDEEINYRIVEVE